MRPRGHAFLGRSRDTEGLPRREVDCRRGLHKSDRETHNGPSRVTFPRVLPEQPEQPLAKSPTQCKSPRFRDGLGRRLPAAVGPEFPRRSAAHWHSPWSSAVRRSRVLFDLATLATRRYSNVVPPLWGT